MLTSDPFIIVFCCILTAWSQNMLIRNADYKQSFLGFLVLLGEENTPSNYRQF